MLIELALVAVFFVILLIIGLSFYYAFLVYLQIRKYRHLVGPEPDGFFGYFFGNIKHVIQEDAKGIFFSEMQFQLMTKYKTKIMKFRMMNNTMVVTTDPRLIKEVLIDQDCIKMPMVYKVLGFPTGERYMGNGLVTDTVKERWKHRRSLFNPGFHKHVLMTFLKEFNTKGDILVEHLKKIADKHTEPISLLEKFNHTALDIIASVAFSMNVDSVNDPSNVFNKYVYESLAGLNDFFRDPLITYKPHKWSMISRYRQVVRHLRDIGRKQIESRIEAIKNDEELPNDILTVILKAHENEIFDIEDMIDQFITFFVAGQETTATTLAAAFLELGRNPEVLEKLRDEIDCVLGHKPEITYDDLCKLKYTSGVFKEALRLYPAAPQISRYSHEEIKIDDCVIPKGTWISINLYAGGRTEQFFPDPYKFDPERFTNESNIQNYTYLPFSLGPRNCIGQNFAQIEAKVLMAKIIQNLDFKLDPNQSFALTLAGTLRPKDGTKCFIMMRS